MVLTNHPNAPTEKFRQRGECSEGMWQTIPNREWMKKRYLKTVYMLFWCRNIIIVWIGGWVVVHWWAKTHARKLHTGNKIAFYLFASQEILSRNKMSANIRKSIWQHSYRIYVRIATAATSATSSTSAASTTSLQTKNHKNGIPKVIKTTESEKKNI